MLGRTLQRTARFTGLLLLMAAIPAVARAAEVSIPHGTVDLLSSQESIQPGHPIMLGLHFRLENGWHIYWINPGDSGEPPRLQWKLPAGVRAGEIEWLAPQRLPIPPLVDYGYEGEVLLPISVEGTSALKAGEQATLAAEVKLIVCREVCIPGTAHVSITLPVRSEAPTASARAAPLFSAAAKALPKPLPASWNPSVRDTGNEFDLRLRTGRRIANAWFAPLEFEQIDNAAPQKFTSSASGLHLILRKSDQLTKPISRLRGVLILAPDRAYVIDAPVTPSPAQRRNKEH